MQTQVLNAAQEGAVEAAAEILRGGGLVAFPTETVYGLGALGLEPAAVERIFVAKGRPHSDPLILHVAEAEWVRGLVRSLPPHAERLMERCWPGPLTLVLPKSERVPLLVTAGQDSVAVRMPRHPVALELIRRVGSPLAAPSANLFSRPSPTTAAHVREDLDGRIHAVLDAGRTEVGVESTVLDARGEVPLILRPGGLSREAIAEVLGLPVALLGEAGSGESPTPQSEVRNPQSSPGLLTKHYSPEAEVRLYEGEGAAVIEAIRRDAGAVGPEKLAVILAFTEDMPFLNDLGRPVYSLGSRFELEHAAHWLYYWLRHMDRKGTDVIFVRAAPPGGLGDAINDRLRRAASGRVFRA
jgi:L-threonylcarbamoyladenylate synthase